MAALSKMAGDRQLPGQDGHEPQQTEEQLARLAMIHAAMMVLHSSHFPNINTEGITNN